MKTTNLLLAVACFLLVGCAGNSPSFGVTEQTVSIPVAGNTYVTNALNEARVSTRGIEQWTGEDAVLSCWFKVSNPGSLRLLLQAESEGASSVIRVSCEGKSFTVSIKDSDIYPIGEVTVKDAGYIRVDIQGVSKKGEQYPKITELLIDGEAAAEPLHFVREFEPYWGLRGPSVHLSYVMPEENVEYFYNEITVPEGEDVIGSYFMTNGFGEGYCGIQVNSPTERRFLFSVWSPFETDNPKEIPEEDRIRMIEKGEGVHVGEFGNEGSGGQSYLIYPWKAGETYRFLTRVKPDGKGNTLYAAWFCEPGEEEWKIIAAFSRPKTDTWYKGAHSFLENFIPSQGYLTRKVHFDNQWVRTVKGEWKELTEAYFTYDNTARAEVRMDYAGGVEEGKFYLKNCGFFNENTEYRTLFTRPAKGTVPVVKGIID